MAEKPPITNCHTHIFTGDHVPPYLAKTFLPAPLYYLIPLHAIVKIFRWWYQGPARWKYMTLWKRIALMVVAARILLARVSILVRLLVAYLMVFAFALLFHLVFDVWWDFNPWYIQYIRKGLEIISPVFPPITSLTLQMGIILFVFVFFKSFRNAIFFAAKSLFGILRKLPGKQSRELIRRYLSIGRYAFHESQGTILSKLKDQYPSDTLHIVLPMDMDYMGAGEAPKRYRDQMAKLLGIYRGANGKILRPFLFADPRRIGEVEKELRYEPGDKAFFTWTLEDNRVKLGDCLVKEYLEENQFSGIKIYPALGYYPFDPGLLPLWKYAADHGIPIMTHCIRGTIFYRGQKKPEWNYHPIFKQAMRGKVLSDDVADDELIENEEPSTTYVPLVLSENKNAAFSINFTHPLNYLCLLEEKLLVEVIEKYKDHPDHARLTKLFGYDPEKRTLASNLKHLKICLAHFGGDDEWNRYLDKDRYSHSSQLTKYPDIGIRFFTTLQGKASPGKIEQLWKYTDWYSIICSMMLQYPNVYADISYILHQDRQILPLLKQTLQNDRLRKRVLFGTDFYVVRNHKSDKHLLADLMGGLSEAEFDQIARINPVHYLTQKPAFVTI